MAGSVLEIDVDEETRSKVERLASERRQPVSALVNEALVQFVDRQTRGESLAEAALAAWTEFQASGLHASHDEVDDWLRRLEAGESIAPPECRR